jgi:hypothetical protein
MEVADSAVFPSALLLLLLCAFLAVVFFFVIRWILRAIGHF